MPRIARKLMNKFDQKLSTSKPKYEPKNKNASLTCRPVHPASFRKPFFYFCSVQFTGVSLKSYKISNLSKWSPRHFSSSIRSGDQLRMRVAEVIQPAVFWFRGLIPTCLMGEIISFAVYIFCFF